MGKYILRPPLAHGRLTLGGDGRVFWELKRPYDDGTTHLAFEPLAFWGNGAGAARGARAPAESIFFNNLSMGIAEETAIYGEPALTPDSS